MAIALSGIAAMPLPGGRTVHSAFICPLFLTREDNPICHIESGSDATKVL